MFAGWDYGEDWSGEFVRETHPFSLTGEGCVQVTESERMAGRGAQDPRELIVPEIRQRIGHFSAAGRCRISDHAHSLTQPLTKISRGYRHKHVREYVPLSRLRASRKCLAR